MSLTAKYRGVDGHEKVVECSRVVAKRLDPKDKHPCAVVVIEPNGHMEQYESGTVYVMNSSGATVSQWYIS